jgi:hypothetical protein
MQEDSSAREKIAHNARFGMEKDESIGKLNLD